MKYFGTDGFRGKAGISLNAMHAYRIGRFLGWYYSDNNTKKVRIIIGKDTRISGDMFENALAAGITASGADAYLMNVTPTPSVSYIARMEGFDCGIMISASHNPYYDNGIKVINGLGHKLEESVTELIEEYIDREKDDIPYASEDSVGRTIDYTGGRQKYIDYLISLIKDNQNESLEPFKGIRVVLDCANGSASAIAGKVFKELGAETIVINSSPDGVNINTDCGSTHIEGLQEFVRQNGADIGFAFDGDADRCLAVDEKGGLIDGDMIMYLCGRHMKECNRLNDNTVVTTVMSNLGLYKAFDAAGINYAKTAVGDRFVFEKMQSDSLSLGGEQSGHIIFGEYARTGDGVLTALMVMEVLLAGKKKISECLTDIDIYPQLLVNVRVADKKAALSDADVIKASDRVASELGDNGRILLRESGTEPLIRVMVEAESDEKCKYYTDMVVNAIKDKGHAMIVSNDL